MTDEEKLQVLVDTVMKEAAEVIIPRLKLVNSRLRGVINEKARKLNLETLEIFISEVYEKGLHEGYEIAKIELPTNK